MTEHPDTSLAAALSNSGVFRDYEAAFTKATGLPLILREPGARKPAPPWPAHSPFCVLMNGAAQTCGACHALQSRLEKEARQKPSTLRCFAGLCETSIPVRISSSVVAYLETGHILLDTPDHHSFKKVARAILDGGAGVDMKRAEKAWLSTKVLTPEQYEGCVHLLDVFARHLEMCGSALVLDAVGSEEMLIQKAKAYIAAHSAGDLKLGDVARAMNLSAHHFCRRFKTATGVTFIDYLARVRVEKARQLLRNPDLRIGEVAYQSGFRCLSQFNRVFRRIVRLSPSDFRKSGGAGRGKPACSEP